MNINDIINNLRKRQEREKNIIYDTNYLNWLESFIKEYGELNTKNLLSSTNNVQYKNIQDLSSLFWNLYFNVSKDKINIDNGEYIIIKRNNIYYRIGYYFDNGNGTIFYMNKLIKADNYLDFDLIVNYENKTKQEPFQFDTVISKVLAKN
jgi:hypothetical protein